MPRHWFVKSTCGSIGPITSRQLIHLAAIGKVRRSTEVSADGKAWITASKISKLTFAQAKQDLAVSHWHVKTSRGVAGPFSYSKLQSFTVAGRIKPCVAISRDMETWIQAHELPGLEFSKNSAGKAKSTSTEERDPDDQLTTHYARRFGRCDRVVQGKVSVRIYPANQVRPMTTLVTHGLSKHKLAAVAGPTSPRRELILYVDKVHEAHSSLLQCLARALSSRSDPFGYGDVIANKQPAKPIFRGGILDHFLMMIPNIPSDFAIRGDVSIDNEELHLMWVVPITAAEKTIVQGQGIQAFCSLMDQSKHPLTLKPKRNCYSGTSGQFHHQLLQQESVTSVGTVRSL